MPDHHLKILAKLPKSSSVLGFEVLLSMSPAIEAGVMKETQNIELFSFALFSLLIS
jgi:hypothetical protein